MYVKRLAVIAFSAAAGLLMAVPGQTAEQRNISAPVITKIDCTILAMYPGGTVTAVYWFGPFRQRGDAGQSVGADQVAAARDVISGVSQQEDPVWFGSTSPMRLDPLFSKNSVTIDDLFQQDLRIRRANVMNHRTGDAGVLATAQNIGMDRPGAYLVIVHRPSGMPSLVPGREQSVALPPSSIMAPAMDIGAWIRPTVGLGGLTLEDNSVLAPSIGASGGLRFGKYDVGLYGQLAQNFRANNRGWFSSGVQFGDDLGLFFRTGVTTAWNEYNFSGFNRWRGEGLGLSVGYGFAPATVVVTAGLLRHSSENDDRGKNSPFIGLGLNLGPCFHSLTEGAR